MHFWVDLLLHLFIACGLVVLGLCETNQLNVIFLVYLLLYMTWRYGSLMVGVLD